MKKIYLATILLFALNYSSNTYAFIPDITKVFSKPASKAEFTEVEEKQLDTLKLKPECYKHFPYGFPLTEKKEILENSFYICNQKNALQYHKEYKTPILVTEVLNKEDFKVAYKFNDITYSRRADVPLKFQAKVTDYDNSGYLMLNLLDIVNQRLYEAGKNEEDLKKINENIVTLSLTTMNVAPAHPTLRTGVWQELENYVRHLLLTEEKIYVTTGVIYENDKPLEFISSNKIAVPTHFYKLVTNPNKKGSVAFIIPNKEILHNKNKLIINKNKAFSCNGGNCNINNFIVNIDNLEKVTNIKFYPNLSKEESAIIKLNPNELKSK